MSDEPSRNAGKQPSDGTPQAHKEPKSDLTKRNADFMFKLRKELAASNLDTDKQRTVLQETELELLDGQKTGKTAKQLYGTPTQRLQDIIDGPKKKDSTVQETAMWMGGIDNGLMFLGLFASMYTILSFIQPGSLAKSPGPAGATAMILTSAVGGFGMMYIYRALNPGKQRPSMWRQILIIGLSVVIWMGFYLAFSAIPQSINPLLPAVGYLMIAIAAFAGRWYFRRTFHITGGIF